MSTPTKIAIVDKSSGAPAVPAGDGLVAAIAAVMTEVHVVAKRGVNTFHGYRFAMMGDILQEITPLLGKHGLVIFQSETGRAMFDEDNVIAIEYAFTVAHASGETWPHAIKQTGVSTCRNSKGGWDDKSLNKCHTAARKYFLLSLFQIPTGEEADADQGENDRPALPAKRPEYVVPPPSRRLKEGGIADRAMVARAHKSWARPAGPSQPFLAKDAGKEFAKAGYDERNPPPHDTIPDHAARALNRRLHPMNDELPAHSAPPDVNRPRAMLRAITEPPKAPLDLTDINGTPAFLRRAGVRAPELAPPPDDPPYWIAALDAAE